MCLQAGDQLYAGYMSKLGAVRKNWKKRWFVLGADFSLRYLESKDSREPKVGSVALQTSIDSCAVLSCERALLSGFRSGYCAAHRLLPACHS